METIIIWYIFLIVDAFIHRKEIEVKKQPIKYVVRSIPRLFVAALLLVSEDALWYLVLAFMFFSFIWGFDTFLNTIRRDKNGKRFPGHYVGTRAWSDRLVRKITGNKTVGLYLVWAFKLFLAIFFTSMLYFYPQGL